jgi:hypothetical protein
MIWQEEMKRDAAKIAFPGFELEDMDLIGLAVRWDEGYSFEDSFEPTELVIAVWVTRAGDDPRRREYTNENAQSFFTALMRRMPQEDINALDVMTRIAKREALRDPLVRTSFTDDILESLKGVYDSAMRWLSVNDYTRAKVHELVENGKHGNPRNSFS